MKTDMEKNNNVWEDILKEKELPQNKMQLEQFLEQRSMELMQINEKLRCQISEKKWITGKLATKAAIVENAEDAIYSLNLDGIVISWNKGAEEMYGLKEEDLVGNSIYNFCPVEQHHRIRLFLKKVLETGHSVLGEGIRIGKDKKIEVSVKSAPIKDCHGKIIGVSIIDRNIAKDKKIEEEMARLERLNLVAELSTVISHEVRNPLTTVQGLLQLLIEKKEDHRDIADLRLMLKEVYKATKIIKEFAKLTRLQGSNFKEQKLNPIIKEIYPIFNAWAVKNNNDVQLKLNHLPNLLLDDQKIKQMILHLARNGCESMHKGGTLILETFSKGDTVILNIIDQGKGISLAVLNKIGNPFFTTKKEGTGMGLVICHRIVEEHHGFITIRTGCWGTIVNIHFKVTKKLI